jgi:predicted RNA-binding protein YlxR (DUF448 family)
MEVNYRRCVSCRRIGHKSEFWRIVRVHPDQTVQLDERKIGWGDRSKRLFPKRFIKRCGTV